MSLPKHQVPTLSQTPLHRFCTNRTQLLNPYFQPSSQLFEFGISARTLLCVPITGKSRSTGSDGPATRTLTVFTNPEGIELSPSHVKSDSDGRIHQ